MLVKPDTHSQNADDAGHKAAFVLRLLNAVETTLASCADPVSKAGLTDMASWCKSARKKYKECLEKSEPRMPAFDRLSLSLAFVDRNLFNELQPDGAEVIDAWLFTPQTLQKPEGQVSADETAFFVFQLHRALVVAAAGASEELVTMKRELLVASTLSREAFEAYKAIRDSLPEVDHTRSVCLREMALVDPSVYNILQKDGREVVSAWLPWPTKLQVPDKQAPFKDKVFFLRHLQSGHEAELIREEQRPSFERREVKCQYHRQEAEQIAKFMTEYAITEGEEKEKILALISKLFGIVRRVDKDCLKEQQENGAHIADAWFFSMKGLTYPFHKATLKEKIYFLIQLRTELLSSVKKVDNDLEQLQLREVVKTLGNAIIACGEYGEDDARHRIASEVALHKFAHDMVDVNPSLFNNIYGDAAKKVQAWLYDSFASPLQKPTGEPKTEEKLYFLLRIMAAMDRLQREEKFKGRTFDETYKYRKASQTAAEVINRYWTRISDGENANRVFEEYFMEAKKGSKKKDTNFDTSVFNEIQPDGADVFKAWETKLAKGKVAKAVSTLSCRRLKA